MVTKTITKYAAVRDAYHHNGRVFFNADGVDIASDSELTGERIPTFDTFAEALVALVKSAPRAGIEASNRRIVRVVTETIETLAREERRELAETAAAQDGETVMYALWGNYVGEYYGGRDDPWTRNISDARLFETHARVLQVVVERYDSGCTIKRIAVRTVPGEPTTTYRVEEIV